MLLPFSLSSSSSESASLTMKPSAGMTNQMSPSDLELTRQNQVVIENPLWCADKIDANIGTLKKALRTDSIRFEQYRRKLFYGHPSLTDSHIKGLVGIHKCGPLILPTHPAIHHRNSEQLIANSLWNIQLLNDLYKKILKLIKIHQQTSISEEDISKLNLMQVMIELYKDHMEEYVLAERCSCEGVQCSIHMLDESVPDTLTNIIRMKQHPSQCSRINMIGQVVRKVAEEVQVVDKMLKEQSVGLSEWELCKTTTNLMTLC